MLPLRKKTLNNDSQVVQGPRAEDSKWGHEGLNIFLGIEF